MTFKYSITFLYFFLIVCGSSIKVLQTKGPEMDKNPDNAKERLTT